MSTTTSQDELRLALREMLEARGVLGDVRARLRSEIFAAIEDDPSTSRTQAKMPMETAVVAELFREFLSFSGYSQTLSVFDAESGYNANQALTREIIKQDLGVVGDDAQLPLAYSLIESLKRQRAAGLSSSL